MAEPRNALMMPFECGIDTLSHERAVQAPYLLVADNVYLNRSLGLQKRYGLTSLTKTCTNDAPIALGGSLVAYRNELLLCDNTRTCSYSQAQAAWVKRDTLISAVAATRQVTTTQGFEIDYTVDSTGQFEVIAYRAAGSSTDVQCLVNDLRSGGTLFSSALTSGDASGAFRLVATSSSVLLIYGNGYAPNTTPLTSTLAARAIFCGPAIGLGPKLVLSSTALDHSSFDVQSNGTTAFAAFTDNLGLRVVPLTPQGALGTLANGPYAGALITSPGPPSNQNFAPALVVQPNNLAYVTLHDNADTGNNLYLIAVNVATGATFSTITIPKPNFTRPYTGFKNGGILFDAANNPVLLVECQLSGSGGTASFHTTDILVYTATTYPGGALSYTLANTLYGAAFHARPFSWNGDMYGFVTNQTWSGTTQPTSFLYNFSRQRYVARLAYGTTDVSHLVTYGTFTNLRPVTTVGSNTIAFAAMQLGSPQSTGQVFSVQWVPSAQLQSAQLGQQMHFAGSIIASYDGAQVTEHGFLLAPEIIAGTAVTGSGLAVGTYVYEATWEWTDARGQLHRSAPSNPLTVTTTSGSQSVSLQVAPLQVTAKSNVTLALYRTTSNGTVYYRLPSMTPSTTYTGIYLYDVTPDSTISSNATLYTVGGELENDAPVSSSLMLAAKNRLLLAEQDTIYYSKQAVLNAGVSFSLGLSKRVATLPGDITALGLLDDKIIVCKPGGMLFFTGTGVAASGIATGNNDDFSEPQLITTEITCQNPQSILTTAQGMYFQSPTKGIWLLTRGLDLIYVGAPVEAYNSIPVVSAQMVPALGQIRFGTQQGQTLVYHYRQTAAFGAQGTPVGAWTTYSNYAQVDATTWLGAYTLARADGTVCQENTGHLDGALPVIQTLKTAWLTTSPAGFARFAEMAVLGEYKGPHRLQMDLAVGYVPSPVARLTLDTATALSTSAWGADASWGASSYGGDGYNPYVVRVHELPTQMATAAAIQWTLTDAPSSGGGAVMSSYSIHALVLMTDPQSGLLRTPAKLSL